MEDKKLYAIIITGLLTMSFCAFWMALEYICLGEIKPNFVHDIVTLPVMVSFYFNSKQIVSKYFK